MNDGNFNRFERLGWQMASELEPFPLDQELENFEAAGTAEVESWNKPTVRRLRLQCCECSHRFSTRDGEDCEECPECGGSDIDLL